MNYTFPSTPKPNAVSDKYVMVDTNRVIAEMAGLDYRVGKVTQAKGRYGFHSVDFIHVDAMKAKNAKGETPKLVFLNSYDGTVKASFAAGIIRWICSNGLISGDLYAKQKTRHIGDEAKSLLDKIKDAAVYTDRMIQRIAKAKTVEMSPAQILALSEEMVGLVKEELVPQTFNFTQPRRLEDTSKDLWTQFNVVQENLIKGGIPVLGVNGAHLVTKPIADPKRDFQVNTKIWTAFDTFLEEATA